MIAPEIHYNPNKVQHARDDTNLAGIVHSFMGLHVLSLQAD